MLSKLETARWVLSVDDLFVHLDPRAETVTVPPWLKYQSHLVLQFGTSMPVPIPDLHLDESGIYGTLSFNHTPYTCAVPWRSVFRLVTSKGLDFKWPEDLPLEPISVPNKKLPKGWKLYVT